MGRVFIEYIEQSTDTDRKGRGKPGNLQSRGLTAAQKIAEDKKQGQLIFTCKDCGIHMADNTDFISKDFRGKTGTAFLFSKV